MTTWKQQLTCAELNEMCKETLVSNLEIQVNEIGTDFIRATMPVNSKTSQPFGFLHGGASCALAETLGSIASFLTIETEKIIPMGKELTSTHLKPVTIGNIITGEVRAKSLHKNFQEWNIEIYDQKKNLINRSTLSCVLVTKK